MTDTAPAVAADYSPAARRAGLGDPLLRARRRRTAFWPVTEHMLWLYWRYRSTMITSAVMEPLLYLLGMGVGLGSVVSAHAGAGTYGVSYVEFVAPALLVTACTMVGAMESTYQVLGGLVWDSKHYYTTYQASVSPRQLAVGVLLAIQIRVVAAGAVYYAIMLALGVVAHPWAGLLVVPLGSLSALALGNPMAAFFARMRRDGGAAGLVQRFVVMPLLLFAGTYYPLDVLPAAIRWIGCLSPVWHATELGRGLCFGHAEPGWLVAVHVVYPLALAVIGALLFARTLGRRLSEQ